MITTKNRVIKGLNRLLGWGLVFSLLFVYACKEPFNVDITGTKTYYVIDGTITTKSEEQLISIFVTNETSTFKSSQFTSTIFPKPSDATPITGAEVKVFENKITTYLLTETQPGFYKMPLGFAGKVGSSYAIEITTKQGVKIISETETILPVSKIDKIYDVFNQKGIEDKMANEGQISTNDLYIDFEDPKTERNFYRWKWISYEIQNFCATCRQGRYNVVTKGETRTDFCETDLSLFPVDYFDYECDAFCWDIFTGRKIDIFSDVFTNGLPQKDKLVAQIPLYQTNPCLVVVEQLSLSPNAYRYIKLIQDQAQNNGTLADTPPAPLRGNLKEVNNPNKLVLGYFGASAVEEVRYMMDRKNTRGGVPNSLFRYQNRREPNIEAPSDTRPFIPLAICKPSVSRTPNSPAGWQFGIR